MGECADTFGRELALKGLLSFLLWSPKEKRARALKHRNPLWVVISELLGSHGREGNAVYLSRLRVDVCLRSLKRQQVFNVLMDRFY